MRARAEIIYKCGNTYSSTPCPGSTVLTVDDSRDAAQKQQADAATRRDAKLAAAMEKERMAQERAAQLAQSSQIKKTKKATGKTKTAPFKPRHVKAKPQHPAASTPSATVKPGRQPANTSSPTVASP